MGLVIDGVAAFGLEIDRDTAVPGDGEDEQQLLQVGPVVLVVPPGDRQPHLLLALLLVGRVGVVAVERDGGGVVVQLVESHAESRDGVSRDRQGEGTAVVLEQAVETPSHAIVIERGDLPIGEPEQVGGVPRRPLADAVEGLAGQEQVLEQDQEPGGRIDAAAAVLRW